MLCVLVLVAVVVYFIQEWRTAKGRILPTVVFAIVMYCASVAWGMFAMLIKLTLVSVIVAVLPFNVIGWLTVEILGSLCGKLKRS